MKTSIAKISATVLYLTLCLYTRAAVTLQDFKLTGDLGGDVAAFTLTGNAKVDDSNGGALKLVSGPVALTSLPAKQRWQMDVDHTVARFRLRSISMLPLPRAMTGAR